MILSSALIFQTITVKEKDLVAAFKSVFFILRENIAFTKQNKLLDLLSDMGVMSSKEVLPGNANLRSQMIKEDLIETIGKINM